MCKEHISMGHLLTITFGTTSTGICSSDWTPTPRRPPTPCRARDSCPIAVCMAVDTHMFCLIVYRPILGRKIDDFGYYSSQRLADCFIRRRTTKTTRKLCQFSRETFRNFFNGQRMSKIVKFHENCRSKSFDGQTVHWKRLGSPVFDSPTFETISVKTDHSYAMGSLRNFDLIATTIWLHQRFFRHISSLLESPEVVGYDCWRVWAWRCSAGCACSRRTWNFNVNKGQYRAWPLSNFSS